MYEPPPWDEPWTPGHRLGCQCHSCVEAAKYNREMLEKEMDAMTEEDCKKAVRKLRSKPSWFSELKRVWKKGRNGK